MGIAFVVVAAVLLVAAVYAVMLYNGLVQLKHNVARAWANIDVLLKQRHDELPKLVETCKRYMAFEQDTLARVMKARGRVSSARDAADVRALGQAEGTLRASLGRLFALAEAYPELKTDQAFRQLQARISELENAAGWATWRIPAIWSGCREPRARFGRRARPGCRWWWSRTSRGSGGGCFRSRVCTRRWGGSGGCCGRRTRSRTRSTSARTGRRPTARAASRARACCGGRRTTCCSTWSTP